MPFFSSVGYFLLKFSRHMPYGPERVKQRLKVLKEHTYTKRMQDWNASRAGSHLKTH